MIEATFPCPCCGFLAFDESPGSYAICKICGWEDDAVQLANPCTRGGANSMSLADAQENFQLTTPLADLEQVCESGFVRDPKWRPLNMTEKEIFKRESDNGAKWINPSVTDVEGYYWSRNVVDEKG